MLTEKDYCDYDTCVALKELGYKEPTSAYYLPKNTQLIFVINPFRGGAIMDCFYSNNSLPKECMASDFIDAPTMWEAQKWLREEKKIGVFVSGFKNGYTFWVNNLLNGDTLYQGFFDNQTNKKYKSYEEALLEGIKEAIKILKEE